MLAALINRDFIILKKEKFHFIAPVFLLAGIVAEFACYLLTAGFILSIMTNKDFKYNVGILMHSMIDNREKYVVLRFLALLVYIPISAVFLTAGKYLLSLIFSSYTFTFNFELTLINMLVAVSILSIIYILSIKLGAEAIGFIFTMMMMGFSAMGIFQKRIDLLEIKFLGVICVIITVLMMAITVKIYKHKDF